MKVNLTFDCTPEEARAFLGLPDLAPVHAAFTTKMTEAMQNGVTPDMVEGVIRGFAPMGEAGLKLWSGLFDRMGGTPDKR